MNLYKSYHCPNFLSLATCCNCFLLFQVLKIHSKEKSCNLHSSLLINSPGVVGFVNELLENLLSSRTVAKVNENGIQPCICESKELFKMKTCLFVGGRAPVINAISRNMYLPTQEK